MRRILGLVSLLLSLVLSDALAAYAPAEAKVHPSLSWTVTTVGSDQELRGLAPVGHDTAWVSGDSGGVWRTTDGGSTWQDVSPPGSTEDTLYRDIEATDADHAWLLAIGEGEDSAILRTTDGGATWMTTFVNDDPNAFYDCMAVWPGGRNGIAMSDPPDGKFRIIRTHDFGRSWSVVPNSGMPPAADGEFGFAASGTCLVTAGARDAFLASGGAASRIYRSHDRGTTWTAVDSPISASPAGGTFGLAFRNPRQGLAVGGDYTAPDNGAQASAYTRNGGHSWTGGGDLGGYRSGVAFVSGTPRTAIAVGTSGSDVTYDSGRTWAALGSGDDGFDAVQCVPGGACWASGAGGRVGVLHR
jgi:photosystem II stability/assembly factor-like uncharacterized protein